MLSETPFSSVARLHISSTNRGRKTARDLSSNSLVVPLSISFANSSCAPSAGQSVICPEFSLRLSRDIQKLGPIGYQAFLEARGGPRSHRLSEAKQFGPATRVTREEGPLGGSQRPKINPNELGGVPLSCLFGRNPSAFPFNGICGKLEHDSRERMKNCFKGKCPALEVSQPSFGR